MTRYALKFLLVLSAVLILHVLVLYKIHHAIDYEWLFASYIINYLLALGIVVIILHYIDKLKTYTGFLFMAGSLIKFAVFFIAFYPHFKTDGVMNKTEFTYFFVPYIICLIMESKKLIRITNNL